jgi:hypothetical protein
MWRVTIARMYDNGTWDSADADLEAPGNVAAVRDARARIRRMIESGSVRPGLVHAFVMRCSLVVTHTHSTYRQPAEGQREDFDPDAR